LRAGLLGQVGNWSIASNTLAVRPAVVLDLWIVKVKGDFQ
jgi:hypothetical protein